MEHSDREMLYNVCVTEPDEKEALEAMKEILAKDLEE